MKRWAFLSLTLVMLCTMAVIAGCDKKDQQGTSVALVFPVTVDAFVQFRQECEKVLTDHGVKVHWFSAEGDASRFDSSLKAAILRRPDVLVTVGTQITNTAFGPQFEQQLPKVVASAISDPNKVEVFAGIGVDPPRSRQLAILSDTPEEDIYSLAARLIDQVLGNGRKVGILYNLAEINSVNTAESLASSLKDKGMTILPGIISSGDDVERVTKSLLMQGADLLVIPHDKYAIGRARTIVKLGLEGERKTVPVFSLDDGTVRRDGAAFGVSVNYGELGRKTGEVVLAILQGQDPATMPVQRLRQAKVYLNTSSLKATNLEIPPAFRQEAVIYSDEEAAR
jgi:putative ABC transport system substrate-binding protein